MVRVLIVEDDFVSRRLMQRLLEPYGECDIAVNGIEAVKVFRLALDEGKAYDLLCLDIMMPGMDGQEVLREIRSIEQQRGIPPGREAKVIMTTALSDRANVLASKESKCVAYLVKPIDRKRLLRELAALGLIENGP